jgi:hypothetical protein
MAGLSDLVAVVAAITGIPEATVFAYGRFARQGGQISQKGRGRSAADMSLTDAANLLIAIAGSDVTKDAATTIQTFRSLRHGRVYCFAGKGALKSEMALLSWLLNTVGVKTGEHRVADYGIQKDFGSLFEGLLKGMISGAVAQIFSEIPVAEVPRDLRSTWIRENSPNLMKNMEELIELGFAKVKEPSDLEFGEDIQLEIKFSRLVPAIEIEFIRQGDNAPELVHSIAYGPEGGAQAKGAHQLRVHATLTQHSLAAAALTLTGKFKKSALKTYEPVEWLFWNQFRPEEIRDEHFKSLQFALGQDFAPRRPYEQLPTRADMDVRR